MIRGHPARVLLADRDTGRALEDGPLGRASVQWWCPPGVGAGAVQKRKKDEKWGARSLGHPTSMLQA